MQRILTILCVGLVLVITGCSPKQSVRPMVQPVIPPQCLTECAPIQPLNGDSQSDILIWTYDLIDTYGECRRLHASCRRQLYPKLEVKHEQSE